MQWLHDVKIGHRLLGYIFVPREIKPIKIGHCPFVRIDVPKQIAVCLTESPATSDVVAVADVSVFTNRQQDLLSPQT